jgi:hypothetical protein
LSVQLKNCSHKPLRKRTNVEARNVLAATGTNRGLSRVQKPLTGRPHAIEARSVTHHYSKHL